MRTMFVIEIFDWEKGWVTSLKSLVQKTWTFCLTAADFHVSSQLLVEKSLTL